MYHDGYANMPGKECRADIFQKQACSKSHVRGEHHDLRHPDGTLERLAG
jgi:hypothetical protein